MSTLASTGPNTRPSPAPAAAARVQAPRTPAAPAEPAAAAAFDLRPGTVYAVLVAAIACLFVAGIVAPLIYHNTTWGGLKHLMLRFDPGQEANLPTWFASAQLLLIAAVVLVIAVVQSRAGQRRHLRRWYALAALILVAAIDETAGFHELLTPATKKLIATAGFFDNAWMIPVSVGLLVLAVAYLPWLRALPRRTAGLVALAGAIFVGGAMACEGAGSVILDHLGPGGLPYAAIVATEESLENLGAATFLFAMLTHLRDTAPSLTLRLAGGGTP